MSIESKKAKEIDAYIKSKGKACERGKQKIVIDGKANMLMTYSLPITMLQYNYDNRRFSIEILEEEKKLGRNLDTEDKEDIDKIKKLLLADKPEAKKLKDDLKKVGEQTEVAAITHDGVVINGNRRMAILEELHRDEPTGKWKELWVFRLPKEISEQDLWGIEAGFQLSKEKVADYGPVHNLLMIKEGKRVGLSAAEIAAKMYGWTEKQVKIDLERLALVDTFLLFMQQPENYGLIKKFRMHEHFQDIQKGLVDKMKKSGAPKREITKKLHTAFLYLRARVASPDFSLSYRDVRTINKILQDFEANAELTEGFSQYKDIRKIPVEKLIDNLDKAGDAQKNKEFKKLPTKLLDRALNALNSIDRGASPYKTLSEVKTKLREIDKLIQEMKTDLGLNKK